MQLKWKIVFFTLIIAIIFTGTIYIYRGSLEIIGSNASNLRIFMAEATSQFNGENNNSEQSLIKKYLQNLNLNKLRDLFSGEFLKNSKKEIISGLINYINNEYEIEFKAKDISIWPLNRITLENVFIKNEENVQLKAGQINIHLNLFSLIQNSSWDNTIEQIVIKEPILNIYEKDDFEFNEGEINVPFYNIDVVIKRGKITFISDSGKIEAQNFHGTVNYTGPNDYKIKARAEINLNNVIVADNHIDDFNLKEVIVNGEYVEGEWQGKIKAGIFDLQKVFNENILKDIKGKSDIDFTDISGEGKIICTFSGLNKSLEDYQIYFNLKHGQAIINYNNYFEQEKFKIAGANLLYTKSDQSLKFHDVNFQLADNYWDLQAKVNIGQSEPEIIGKLNSKNLQLTEIGSNIHPELEKINTGRKSELEIIFNGNLLSPGIDLNFYLPQVEYRDHSLNYVKGNLFYREDMIFIDAIEAEIIEEEKLIISGVFDPDTYKYNLEVKGDNINTVPVTDKLDYDVINSLEIDDLERYQEQNRGQFLKGKLDLYFSVTGSGLNFNQLLILGDMGFTANSESDFYHEINTDFWLKDNNLILNEGQLVLEQGKINFSGNIDFTEDNFDLGFRGQNLDVENLKTKINIEDYQIPELSGKANFDGSITSDFTNPLINLDITIDNGNLMGYNYKQLSSFIEYQDKNLTINNLEVNKNEAVITGTGFLNFAGDSPFIDMDAELSNITNDDVKRFIELPLTYENEVNADLQFRGLFDDIEISGKLYSQNFGLKLPENNFITDDFKLLFSWQNDHIAIENLLLKKDESQLEVAGKIIEEGLDLKYQVENIKVEELSEILNYNYSGFNGLMDLEGDIKGHFSSPVVSADFEVYQILYSGKRLDEIKGHLKYKDDSLLLSNCQWYPEQSDYLLAGKIGSLSEEPYWDMEVETKNGNLSYLLDIFALEIPFKLDYYLQGNAGINGPLAEPEFIIDFYAHNPQRENGTIFVSGEIGDKIDLNVEGKQIQSRAFSYSLADNEFNISGIANFEGNLTGTPENLQMTVSNKIENIYIDEFLVESIEGNMTVDNRDTLFLNQKVNMTDQSNIKVKGDIILKEDNKLDLQVSTTHFYLDILSKVFPAISEIDGYFNGNVKMTGAANNPDLSGDIQLTGEDIDVGLPETINLITGDFIFAGNKIQLSDIRARYGGEDINIRGKFKPFMTEDFWHLQLDGKNIPFEHGSYKGEINPEITIAGPFFKPFISGEALTHNFVVEIPFDWPGTEIESEFAPELDVVLYPGENVYFRDVPRIDFMIEKGSLNINYKDKEIDLVGELFSERGSFDYYNNRFIVENARAVFRSFEGYMPQIHVTAYTNVSGNRIIIRLDGPAENMVTSFASQPELSREEILNLLTRKGGLGEIISGEKPDVGRVLSQELFRFFRDTLQLDLITGMEDEIKRFFSLDRMEIDTYNIGFDQRINVYLGKYFTDSFYLEYSSQLALNEREDILSFRYDFTDRTNFKGSWKGRHDYRILLETGFDF